MAQTFGIMGLVWNGRTIQVEKGGTILLSGYKQNPVVTGKRVDYSQEYQAGTVTATTILPRGARLSDWLPNGEGELQVQCDSGQSFTMPDAFLADPPKATGGEGGKIERTWNFGEYEEILNG